MAATNLMVYLNDVYIGMLTQLVDGRALFAFDDNYRADAGRPNLSLSYLDAITKAPINKSVIAGAGKLPPFFSNLLPEGKMRTYLARQANVRETQEMQLLASLSDDLPGAVLLKSVDGQQINIDPLLPASGSPRDREDVPMRFSLAGVQLKFSGDLIKSKMVIPARGVGGHWILKLPTPTFAHINELEYSMLRLASEIGINVPEFDLLPLSSLKDVPAALPKGLTGNCLVSKRFDRVRGNSGETKRIHMEDFAQVFALYDKYDSTYNYQSIANVLWQASGRDDILEFVRRLVHMCVTGNGDMHLKNWSLIYPDGRSPRLSPAYDFVSTIVYPEILPSLPHKIAGVKNFNSIDIDAFKRFSNIARLPENAVVDRVRETVKAIRGVWPRLRDDMPIPENYKKSIEDHMKTVPIMNDRI